jgi:hypothetical protein
LGEEAGLNLVVARRTNMKEQLPGWLEFVCHLCRKRVETTFSQLFGAFRPLDSRRDPCGFELKVFLTVLAFSPVG